MFSQCRQINDCKDMVGEFVAGTKGKSNCADLHHSQHRRRVAIQRQKRRTPYELEHADLIASIRDGKPSTKPKTSPKAP